MEVRASAPVAESDDVYRAVASEAQRHAGTWFPEFEGRQVRTKLLRREQRPRCLLYWIGVGDGRTSRNVVVKVRHSIPELRRVDRSEGRRPVLTPERTLPDLPTAHREYEGLRLAEHLFRDADRERFGVLRPLAWLPEHGAIVMDHISEPTLHRVLVSQSRWRIRPLLPAADPRPWANAGAWLRIFHRADPALDLTQRAESRDDLIGLLAAYADFLGEQVGDRRFFTELADVASHQAAATLPARLPLALGHGDYTMRNLFISPAGRVTVFDPLPLWRVPQYEDLARFVIGLRLLSVQAVTRGAAYSDEMLGRCESAFLQAYFGDEPVPPEAVRVFQVLLLLDKWGGTASKQNRRGGVRRQLRAARVQLSHQHYRAEARRLVALLA